MEIVAVISYAFVAVMFWVFVLREEKKLYGKVTESAVVMWTVASLIWPITALIVAVVFIVIGVAKFINKDSEDGK